MEITINKKSWHYRWFKKLHTFAGTDIFKDPTSVCSYFWRFIGYNIKSLGLCFILAVVGIFLSAPIWGFIGYYFTGIQDLFAGASIVTFLWIVIGIIVLIRLISDKYEYSSKDSGFIGVSKGMFYSIKHKVCPMIKYEEE